MNAQEKAHVRGEVRRLITALVLRDRKPDPTKFSPLLLRVLRVCQDGDDVLALVVSSVAELPLIGNKVAAYVAKHREQVVQQLAPHLEKLKADADAA